MDFWILFFKSLPWWLWVGLFMFIGAIYCLFIAPILFNFWVIPKIENRYHTEFKIIDSQYISPFASFIMPALQISIYVTLKYFNCKWRNIFERPDKRTLFVKLNKINYDINTASKSEIIMSFITVFFFNFALASMIIFGAYLILEKYAT